MDRPVFCLTSIAAVERNGTGDATRASVLTADDALEGPVPARLL